MRIALGADHAGVVEALGQAQLDAVGSEPAEVGRAGHLVEERQAQALAQDEGLGDGGRHGGVGVGEDPRRDLEQRDLRAERREHRDQLGPGVPGADDGQPASTEPVPAGHTVHLEGRSLLLLQAPRHD